LSEPQSPGPWYSPPPPEKKGLSTGAIIAIVVAVVVVVVVVGAIVASAFFAGVLQASNLRALPNIELSNAQGTYREDCGTYGTQTTNFQLSATVVNTGGAGYASFAYEVNGQQNDMKTYFFPADSHSVISDSFTVHACYGSAIPVYTVTLLSERPA